MHDFELRNMPRVLMMLAFFFLCAFNGLFLLQLPKKAKQLKTDGHSFVIIATCLPLYNTNAIQVCGKKKKPQINYCQGSSATSIISTMKLQSCFVAVVCGLLFVWTIPLHCSLFSKQFWATTFSEFAANIVVLAHFIQFYYCFY